MPRNTATIIKDFISQNWPCSHTQQGIPKNYLLTLLTILFSMFLLPIGKSFWKILQTIWYKWRRQYVRHNVRYNKHWDNDSETKPCVTKLIIKKRLPYTLMETLCLVKALLLRSWWMQWMGKKPVILALRLLVTATLTAWAVTTYIIQISQFKKVS